MKNFKFLKKTLLAFAIIFIFGSLLFFGSIINQSKGIPVLNYHRVADNVNNPLTLSTEEFNEQMDYLYQHGYKDITPDDLLSYLQHGTALPDKSVLITFDDGYRDTYTNAYPILKKYGFTASVFLITDVVGHNDWYLNWEQVKEMHQAGFVISSHTLSHVPLTTVSPGEALLQLQKSKEGIEWRLVSAHPLSCKIKSALTMGFLSAYMFLALNGWELDAPEANAAAAVLELAAGEIDEAQFSAWLKENSVKFPKKGLT
jgi:hypothetical protein